MSQNYYTSIWYLTRPRVICSLQAGNSTLDSPNGEMPTLPFISAMQYNIYLRLTDDDLEFAEMPNFNLADIKSRILRHGELIPCKTAFIDARTPGSDKKENFCLIGSGVAENPGQVIHVDIPHGFNVGAAKQPYGCKNSHHSHDTAEVFFVHRGEWKFTWGHDGRDGELVIGEGATISIPTRVFRGFENVGIDDGFLFSVLGTDENGTSGHVTWAPYVFEQAKSHGLVLLEDGRLIDTVAGEKVPGDATVVQPPTPEQVDKYRRLTQADMLACVQTETELASAQAGGLSSYDGVWERAVLGVASPAENIGAGKMAWPHGFQVRRLQLHAGARIPEHARLEEEVLFVHKGTLDVHTPPMQFVLHTGDLFTVPKALPRSFTNQANHEADVVLIRGGDHPQAPIVN